MGQSHESLRVEEKVEERSQIRVTRTLPTVASFFFFFVASFEDGRGWP